MLQLHSRQFSLIFICFREYFLYLQCQRLFYDGKLSPNEKNPWAIFSQLAEMTLAQKIEYHKTKRSMIENEFLTFGLDEIDPTARGKFEDFYTDKLAKMTGSMTIENDNKHLGQGNKSGSITAIDHGSDVMHSSNQIGNSRVRRNANSSALTKVDNPIGNSRLARNANSSALAKVDTPSVVKMKATPKRKGKNIFTESEFGESDKDSPQVNVHRGRKRVITSVASTPRSTPRSSSSPSTRYGKRNPPSKASRKGWNSRTPSDLTEESERDSTPVSDRGR